MTPTDRRYTREHEWARVDAGVADIGITAHAQEQLGDVVYVELPRVGALVKAASAFGSVDSFKASSALFAPVSGEVIATNGELDAKPELVNQDPYGAGWMIRVRLSTPSEFDDLLTAESYDSFVSNETAHA